MHIEPVGVAAGARRSLRKDGHIVIGANDEKLISFIVR